MDEASMTSEDCKLNSSDEEDNPEIVKDVGGTPGTQDCTSLGYIREHIELPHSNCSGDHITEQDDTGKHMSHDNAGDLTHFGQANIKETQISNNKPSSPIEQFKQEMTIGYKNERNNSPTDNDSSVESGSEEIVLPLSPSLIFNWDYQVNDYSKYHFMSMTKIEKGLNANFVDKKHTGPLNCEICNSTNEAIDFLSTIDISPCTDMEQQMQDYDENQEEQYPGNNFYHQQIFNPFGIFQTQNYHVQPIQFYITPDQCVQQTSTFIPPHQAVQQTTTIMPPH